MADGWPVSSPERQGLDGALVCVIGEKLEGLPQRTRTVLLVVVTAGVYDYAGEGGQNPESCRRYGHRRPRLAGGPRPLSEQP